MGMVMVKCPETGRAIPTGMKTDRESFQRSTVFFGRTHCPICHTDHAWFAREAWVHEAGASASVAAHNPEKWVPVFRKDHAQTRVERMTIRRNVITLGPDRPHGSSMIVMEGHHGAHANLHRNINLVAAGQGIS
jgi:hypothetical protein